MLTFTFGFSPCPNDTFIFYALANGRLDTTGLSFNFVIADVEALNDRALLRALDISKVSCGVYGQLRDDYVFLRSGAALGRGCGPLIVARDAGLLDAGGPRPLKIAVPGRHTTAFLLLRLYLSSLRPGLTPFFVFMPFHEIIPAVERSEADGGLIIHESRFTYHLHGLTGIVDLGSWWEAETGLPIPLGGIVARKSLGNETMELVEALISRSVKYAVSHRDEAMPYVRVHARELSEDVACRHIGLYVNEYTEDIGDEGQAALEELLKRADTINRPL